ncbi:MAG TPA: hypothetical protein GX697_00615 [Firmicutes bacterium]|nr:hypothetical protein [Bacillota bacterium]
MIAKEKVVPVDINIGEGFKTLLITGPNTGGKTVILKTVGLFALMAQSGLHVPAAQGTKLAVYDQIFADIGDEQSIEQSLSTFSSHIENIINILKCATSRSLILLDELGAGTDPAEGAALAKGILLYFYNLDATVIATTHYSELKVFVNNHEGMENASVEFDIQTLSPTYKLLMGIPGKSNALAIAERLGMPGGIITKARELQNKSDGRIDDLVEDLVKKQKEAAEHYESIRVMKADAENYLARARSSQEDAEKRKKEILQKAREEALFVITKAKQQADAFHRELKKLRDEQDVLESLGRVQEFREDLKNEQAGLIKDKYRDSVSGETVTADALRPGMELGIKSLGQRGILIDYNSENKEAQLQVGAIKIKTALADLVLPPGEPESKQVASRPYIKLQTEKSRTMPPEINLRGLTLAESIDKVEKYLDDCLLAGMDRVSLIHGKGTGKLRRGLHAYLETVKAVKDFRLGEEGEGDSGVTIVYLNK